jgi:Ni,Fe-hydrogenase III large subunit
MLETLTKDLPAVSAHRGWPRVQADRRSWRAVGVALKEGKLDLLGEWGDVGAIHCALYHPASREVRIVSVHVEAGAVPSLAAFHPAASRLERAIADLFGIEMLGLADRRAWLDHGRWLVRAPLGEQSACLPLPIEYPFLEARGPSLHQIPVGPVHAGIIEPGHFRFNASGETVVRLEERLGYTHKGIEKSLIGCSLETAARIAGRVSGDSTVAYALAFSHAVERALGMEPAPRAVWLRGVMAELERIANHLGDIGAICNDAAFAMMHAECGILRERTLRACAQAFGHRLMMDRVVPGGVTVDLTPEGREGIRALCGCLDGDFSELIELYDSTASLQDRTVGTGIVGAALAAQFAAPGFVGRASGRLFDARSSLPYPPYDVAPIEPVVRQEGDVDARVWVRILETQRSVAWIRAALATLDSLPREELRKAPPAPASVSVESTALVEGFRGDILAYVRLSPDQRIERCHLRDPSWFQWPLLEAAIEGNIVADFPLCNKSFNCSYSGHDL